MKNGPETGGVVMKRILGLLCFAALSCAGTVTETSMVNLEESSGQMDVNIESRKAVVALSPVVSPEDDNLSQTLAEAYWKTTLDLLTSMQTYELRILETGTEAIDLKNRGIDHLIESNVFLNEENQIELKSLLWDIPNQQVQQEQNFSTGDYLALFQIAEDMAYSMVEEFYGEHISLAVLTVDAQDLSYNVFIDGLYRDTDENDSISILAGEHHVLIMGEEDFHVYFNKTVSFEESENKVYLVRDYLLNHLLVMQGSDRINVDGNIEDWNNIPVALLDPDSTIIPQGEPDLQWIKYLTDRDFFYLLYHTENPRENSTTGFYLENVADGTSFQGTATTVNISQNLLIKHITRPEYPFSGHIVQNGEFLELAVPLEALTMHFDEGNLFRCGVDGDNIEQNTTRVNFSSDPTPILVFHNRYYQGGMGDHRSQYLLPPGFVQFQDDPWEWAFVPTQAHRQNSSNSSLLELKSGRSQKSLQFYIRTLGKWSRRVPILIDVDISGDETALIKLERNRFYLQIESNSWQEIPGEISIQENYLEASIELDQFTDTAAYINIMRVYEPELQSQGLLVFPYE